MYKATLKNKFSETGSIMKCISKRYDLVHRNETIKEREDLNNTKEEVFQFCGLIVEFVDKIESELEKE